MRKMKGFSLIELLLLLSVAAIFFALSFSTDTRRTEKLKIDKTVLQMQQILNAGLLYYVNNGEWPDYDGNQACGLVKLTSGASDLQQLPASYLPPSAMPTPFRVSAAVSGVTNSEYYAHVASNATTGICADIDPNAFAVFAWFAEAPTGGTAKQIAMAKAIAAKLPNGYVDSTNKYIGAYIYPPGKDPSSATALSFAGLYHHGACVPKPVCPTETVGGATYIPQIYLTPTSVSGVNDDGSTSVYPISSFSAYASGAYSEAPAACVGSTAGSPTTPICEENGPGDYWRVCLQVITERGDVQVTRTDRWGDSVTIAAFTRCAIETEPAGSPFTVYGD